MTHQSPADVTFTISRDHPKWVRLSAVHDGKEIGHLTLAGEGPTKGVVQAVSVDHAWRRHGIATAMIDHAVKEGLEPRYPGEGKRTMQGILWSRTLGKNLKEQRNYDPRDHYNPAVPPRPPAQT
jgi:GNAT superfamily N-acetyltransferase